MKILISADMEGTCGVTSWVQVMPAEGHRPGTSEVEYERARLRMTREVNAAVAGAFDAGVTEVLVTDAHSSKRNLLPDELDRRVRFISGYESDLGMMQGIDEPGIAAVFFTGYHAKAGTPGAPLAHTSDGWIQDVRVNGRSIGEYGMNAIIAGHFGTPVALVAGDDRAVAQTRELLGEQVVGVITKHGLSTTSAIHVHPEQARRCIRDGAMHAIQNLKTMRPYVMPTSATFEIDFDHQTRTDQASRLPTITRTGERSVSFNPADGYQFGTFWRAILTAGGSKLY